MLKGCMEIFSKLYKKDGERLILDAYTPKNGIYRIISFDGEQFKILNTVSIRTNRKTNETERDCDSATFYDIKFYDYYSKLLTMNKPVDPKKKIHSNNYLSFVAKQDSLVGGEVTAECIRQYYEILANPLIKYKKKETKQLYQEYEERHGMPDAELIEKIKSYILMGEGWKDIDMNGKDYLKLFFILPDQDATETLYRQEGNRYLYPNRFNNNDFNREQEGVIIGVSNDNMGMNAKKPYLANKTRKVEEPYLLTQEEADLQGKFFDYLYGNVAQGRPNVYFQDQEGSEYIRFFSDIEQPGDVSGGYYMRVNIGQTGAEICKFQVIPSYSTKMQRPFTLKDIIGSKQETLNKSTLPYGEQIYDLWKVKTLIDSTFFRGALKSNFFTEEKEISVKDTAVKHGIMEARQALHEWFYEGQASNAARVLEAVSWNLIKNSLMDDDIYGARRQCNLRWSLMDYFNHDERMANLMGQVRTMLRNHLNEKGEWEFTDEKEYSYAVGQLASYLISKSRASNKTASLINPFLNTENTEFILNRLEQLYQKYNYDIPNYGGSRVNKILTRVMESDPKTMKLNKEMILAGFTAESLIYEKKTEETESEGGTGNE